MDYQNVFSQMKRNCHPSSILSFHQVRNIVKDFGWGGLWKWRLFEYAPKESHELLDGLIQKCVQFLAIKEDKRLFRVSLLKIYEYEDLSISAQLYDANYELFNKPDVTIFYVIQ